eukprot:scaffold108341_cov51-Phaeocystis_antarctica.AAC.1
MERAADSAVARPLPTMAQVRWHGVAKVAAALRAQAPTNPDYPHCSATLLVHPLITLHPRLHPPTTGVHQPRLPALARGLHRAIVGGGAADSRVLLGPNTVGAAWPYRDRVLLGPNPNPSPNPDPNPNPSPNPDPNPNPSPNPDPIAVALTLTPTLPLTRCCWVRRRATGRSNASPWRVSYGCLQPPNPYPSPDPRPYP